MTPDEFKTEFMARMADKRLTQGEVLHMLHDAGARYPEHADKVAVSDDLEIDDKPLFSAAEGGVWVMTWTWVPGEEEPEEEPEGED